MISETITSKQRSRVGLYRTATVSVLVSALLAGCSQVPDAVNPVEWYNSSVEFFSGEDQPAEPAQGNNQVASQPAPGAEQQFPSLSTVDQKKQMDDARSQGLVADVEGRKYAPAVARQGEAVNALNAPPAKPPVPTSIASATPTAPTQPAPPASPTITVTSTDVSASTTSPAMPSADGLSTTSGQQDFQAKMMQRLAEIRARAAQGSGLPALNNQPAAMVAGVEETIVISSGGVQSGLNAPAAATSQPLPVATGGSYMQRPVQPIGHGAVKVATIMFGNGSSNLSARDRSILANVRKLQEERGGRLRVIGHASSRTRSTDPVRHKMINFKVSAARADSVAKELLRQGLNKSSLQVDAVSDSTPVYFEFMPTGEAGNRRAEIYLES
jgi:flagellar motor protein MotB